MTEITISAELSPTELRLLDKLKKKLDFTNSEVVSFALRQLAFNVGITKTVERPE